MKKSDELQVKMSEQREAIRTLVEKEGDLNTEDRAALTKATAALSDSEIKFRAALTDEAAAEAEASRGAGDPQTREHMALENRARVSKYLRAAVEGRSIDGAEAEYNKELGLGTAAGAVGIPTELICSDPIEHRVDAVTNPVSSNPVRKGRFLDRVLGGDSFAGRIGVTFDNVPVGVASHVLMTAGTAAHQVAPSESVDAGSAGFAITEMKPSRQTARYVWTIESAAKLEGMEAALRRDIRRVMAIKMDRAIFEGDAAPTGDDSDITGLLTAAGIVDAADVARTATGATFSSLLSSLAGLVDGLYAKSPADISSVFSPGLNQELLKSFPVAGHTDTARKILSDNGFMYGVNDRMSGVTPIAATTLIGVGSKAQYRPGAAVAAMWPVMQAITDPYSGSARGEIALTVHALWNFAVVRPNVFWKMETA